MSTQVQNPFIEEIASIVGPSQVLTNDRETKFYRTGIRVGGGAVSAVLIPHTLLQLWKILEICVAHDKIIIMQAANTGITGGSTPNGDDYDRDVVIINTLKLDQLILLDGGQQVIAFAGSTLYQLEKELEPLNRGPHSVIGSSCIGASIIGGVCNNSGGNLVNRGPAYTELSLYAQLTSDNRLELVNHLEIDLGETPEEIIANLQCVNFATGNLPVSTKLASDIKYKNRVRDIESDTPSRFNADKRRLYESSGCAGKLAVFAVRLDTFEKSKKERVFYIGTNNPDQLTVLRKKILSNFSRLPDMGEYIHRSYFDGSDKYCKDTFLFIKYFGTSFLPKLFSLKAKIDGLLSKVPFMPDNVSDKTLQTCAKLWPNHIPKRLRDYRDRFEPHLMIVASDSVIEETEALLQTHFKDPSFGEYFKCSVPEGEAAKLHRFVAGGAIARYKIINADKSGGLLPLDIALPRNCDNWHDLLPKEILDQLIESFRLSHFFCMVVHWDFVLKKGVNEIEIKNRILKILDDHGAKYPAEHNVGHLYEAEIDLANFYRELDPTNSFNPGIGKTSMKKHYI